MYAQSAPAISSKKRKQQASSCLGHEEAAAVTTSKRSRSFTAPMAPNAADQSLLSTMASRSFNRSNVCLPPISSLILPKINPLPYYDPFYSTVASSASIHYVQPKVLANHPPPKTQACMPMIPYYFHHSAFGIEACMLDLERRRHAQKIESYSLLTAEYHPPQE